MAGGDVNLSRLSIPDYPFLFDFETGFPYLEKKVWVEDNWQLSIYVSILYLIAVYHGLKWMKTRPRFELRYLLAVWNAGLTVFSLCGTLRLVPEVYHIVSNYGFKPSVCNPSFVGYGVTAFWTWMFILSKVYELGDTAFIILRKQPLIFLHWYHHVTVLLYTWYSCSQDTAPARWFVAMNYAVHTIMYAYYCLKALKIRVPAWVMVSITLGQLMQMVVGIFVNYWALQYKQQPGQCAVAYNNIYVSFAMYGSYFTLFCHFFFRSYIATKRHTSRQTAAQPSPTTVKRLMNNNNVVNGHGPIKAE